MQKRDYVSTSLALTFLFVGLGYALPFNLFLQGHTLQTHISPEILNLYFFVGWMGLAHFVYAYHGQFLTLNKNRKWIAPYAGGMLFGASALLGLRQLAGPMIFSFLMWIYFLPHFVRAEVLFSSQLEGKDSKTTWGVYLFPTIAFTFFTVVLFCPMEYIQNRWILIAMAAGCVAAGLLMGLKRQLENPDFSRYALLGIFLIAEGLVWATYRQYMNPYFQAGVYVIHIALASYMHYFRAYGFALSKQTTNRIKYLVIIVLINVAMILLGYACLHNQQMSPGLYVLDVTYFTYWVGLHLFSSELFLILKKQKSLNS
ncbi:MAG: hypothetical protein KIT34_07190 [Cyanobacteria bacterium TGS_CYA1]|nr:hypothetical protein [Cyanobacteria bacterium TGS_CYA1]